MPLWWGRAWVARLPRPKKGAPRFREAPPGRGAYGCVRYSSSKAPV